MTRADHGAGITGRNSNMVKKQKKGDNNFEKKSVVTLPDDSVLGGLGTQGSKSSEEGGNDMYSMMAAAESTATTA